MYVKNNYQLDKSLKREKYEFCFALMFFLFKQSSLPFIKKQ